MRARIEGRLGGIYKLRAYGGSGRLIVMTDASDYWAGWAIFEVAEEFEETAGVVTALKSDQLVGVFGRSFNDSETRRGLFEKEMFALMMKV